MEKYMKALENLGLTITEKNDRTFTAEIETPSGKLEVFCGDNGCAKICKPNGTHKWLYEKSPAQIRQAVNQSLEFWMH